MVFSTNLISKLWSQNVAVGDGRLGYPEDAPYNAIHVGAAAPTLPQAVSFIQFSTTTRYLELGETSAHCGNWANLSSTTGWKWKSPFSFNKSEGL